MSGKFYLFILENTNCTNNTNPCGVLPLLIAYEPKVAQVNPCGGVTLLIAYELHEYHPDNKKRVIDLRVLRFVL